MQSVASDMANYDNIAAMFFNLLESVSDVTSYVLHNTRQAGLGPQPLLDLTSMHGIAKVRALRNSVHMAGEYHVHPPPILLQISVVGPPLWSPLEFFP